MLLMVKDSAAAKLFFLACVKCNNLHSGDVHFVLKGEPSPHNGKKKSPQHIFIHEYTLA